MADEARNPEFDRFIVETGESEKIDAKGPLSWDNGPESARLSKDIAAFANSKDGGVIVVGKSEGDNGGFVLNGLSDEQAATFETTKVATWINNRFSPPISLVCHHHDYCQKKFVIITIDEFSDVPHLCTKNYDDPAAKNKKLLKEKCLYVRNANAESSVLGSVDDLRTLIGLATAKRGHELLAMFSAMLTGHPLLPSKGAEEQFQAELTSVEVDLGETFSRTLKEGAWKLVVRPATFNESRFEEGERLEERIQKRQVQLRSQFPPSRRGTHMRDWGVCNNTYRETWGLTRSGQFVLVRPYYENQQQYECSWRDMYGEPSEPRLPPGQWMDAKPSLFTIAEFFAFAGRFVEEYGTGEQVHFEIRGTALTGRRLVTTDPNIDRDMTPPCLASQFVYTKAASVEEFQATWETNCAQAMKRFSDLFPDTDTSIETMQGWVQRFKQRKF